jgi:hypothetical protein
MFIRSIMTKAVLSALFALSTTGAMPCFCGGPNTFCGVLNPPYEDPEPWLPEAVVMAVPLQHYYYGIDMVILQVYQGEVNNDTIRVWGDNGALCRLSTGSWSTGDTLILGLQWSDLLGNTILNPVYPADLESEGDYMISACGRYALDFQDGLVRGPVDQPTVQVFSLKDFTALIADCALATGLSEGATMDPLLVRNTGGLIGLEWRGLALPGDLAVWDTQGRAVLRRRWDGTYLVLDRLAPGSYVVDVRNGLERRIRKVLVE